MKEHTALKQNINNDTCIEFRRDIKALTLLADATSSGNLVHRWTTRTEKKILTHYLWNLDITVSYFQYCVTTTQKKLTDYLTSLG